MEKKVARIDDLIEIEYLQVLQNGLASITGTSIRLLDNQGADITRLSFPADTCLTGILDGYESKHYARTHIRALERVEKTGTAFTGTFFHSGIKYAVIPIWFKNTRLGNWLIREVKCDPGGGQDEADITAWGIDDDFTIPAATIKTAAVFLNNFSGILTDYASINDTDCAVREKKLAETGRKLQALLRKIRKTSYNFRAAFYVVDLITNEIRLCNKKYAHTFIAEPKDLIGKRCFSLLGYYDLCPYCPQRDFFAKNGGAAAGPFVWEAYLKTADIWIDAVSRIIKSPDNHWCHYVRYADVTNYKKISAALNHIATYDKELKIPTGLLLLDIMKKNENENAYIICFGIHVSGKSGCRDLLLQAVSGWIHTVTGDTLFRITEKEFALLVHGYTEGDAKNAARELYLRLRSPWKLTKHDKPRSVTPEVSMGIIPCLRGVNSYTELISMIRGILDLGYQNQAIFIYEKLEDIISRGSREPYDMKSLDAIDAALLTVTGGGYMLSPGAYRLINQCMYIITTGQADAIETILGLAGTHLGISRAYVFLIDTLIGENIYEWCAPEIESGKNSMTRFLVSKTWRETLDREGIILVSDIDQLELRIRAEMDSQNVLSMAAVPLRHEGKLSGFVGIDECVKKHRRWKPEEIQILQHLCLLVTEALQKESPAIHAEPVTGTGG
jgi:hypothetical protein